MNRHNAVNPDYPRKFKSYVKCKNCGVEYEESLSMTGEPRLHDCGVISDEDEAFELRLDKERRERIKGE